MTKFTDMMNSMNSAVQANKAELVERSEGRNIYTNRFHVKPDEVQNKMVKSRTIFIAKNQVKGGYFQSEITRIVEKLVKSQEALFGSRYNERNYNLVLECQAFIQFVLNTNPEVNLEDIRTQGFNITRRYWDTVQPKKNDYINILDVLIEEEIKENPNGRFVNNNFSNYSTSRKYTFVKDNLPKAKANLAVVKYMEYKQIQAQFEVEARLLCDSDGYNGALLFATVYLFLLEENASIEHAKIAQMTRGKAQDTQVMNGMDENGEYIYTRFASVFDLFAQGTISFFAMLREGKYDLNIPMKKVNAITEFSVPDEKVDAVKSFLKNLSDSNKPLKVQKVNGQLVWKGLVMSPENASLTKKETVGALTNTFLKDVARADEFAARFGGDKCFLKSSVFTGVYDLYQGSVVGFASYNRNGVTFVKVFLADVVAAFNETTKNNIRTMVAQREEKYGYTESDEDTYSELGEVGGTINEYSDSTDVFMNEEVELFGNVDFDY